MAAYLGRRLLYIIPTALGVATIVFLIIHLIPGDPVLAMLGDDAPMEAVEDVRRKLGLDQPLSVQYMRFIGGLFRGELGVSIKAPRPVATEIRRVLPYTVQLAGTAMLIGMSLGLPLGVTQAVRRTTPLDFGASVVSVIWYSAPIFWVALLGMYFFSLRLGWFPLTGAGERGNLVSLLYHLSLPAITLGLRRIALVARMMRSSVLDVLGQDYIRTARSKGLNERVVIYRHALKNAVIPVITASGMEFGTLLGGAVISEILFVRPGMGRLIVQGILGRDYPVVQGTLLVFALIFMLVNLLVDVSYAAIDPRIRYN
ncbi:MAG: ABC transporter permease [Bacillota bacterium]